MAKLAGKVAVITGATSEMALATAKLFVEEGAYVFITGRRQQQLDAAVKAIGRNVTGVQGDADHLTDLDRLYETVNWTGSCNDTQVFPGAWIRLLPQDCLDSSRCQFLSRLVCQ